MYGLGRRGHRPDGQWLKAEGPVWRRQTDVRVAVVGAGISGLGAAFYLSTAHHVDVFEREARLGGHAHTHAIDAGGRIQPIDTGFLVYNTRTYPHFTALLGELGVATEWSEMSFSVQCRRCGLEYASRNARALFAQPARALTAGHWLLLAGILRLFRLGRRFLAGAEGYDVSLGDFLGRARLDGHVATHFVLPMTGAIWSASFDDMRGFPARSILQFLENHGLLSPNAAPRWRTITGGSQQYVRALAARVSGRVRAGAPVRSVRRHPDGVAVTLASGESANYDKVVVATHADEALALLADPSPQERALLGQFRYSINDTVLHTDAGVLPTRRTAWASWNCDVADCRDGSAPVALTYHVNRLQSVTGPTQYCVTLNRTTPVAGDVLARMSYKHPILDRHAVAAQTQLATLDGTRHTYFCGAYLRYGFHEDGLVSARNVAARLGVAF
jgi:predicted NAD/FAD-binding protein